MAIKKLRTRNHKVCTKNEMLVSVVVNKELYKQFKMYALTKDVAVTALTRTCLRKYIEECIANA